MRDVPLATILDVVARCFGLDVAAARTEASEEARSARRVFCYLARGLTQASAAEIGEMILERALEAHAAAEEVAGRLSEGRELAELVVEAEIEVRALVELSALRGLPLPSTAAPRTIALRLVGGRRDAVTVGRADLAALAAAYLARTAAAPPALTPEPSSPLQRALATYERAAGEAVESRYTRRERGAIAAREAARAQLLKLLGEPVHVEA